MAVMSVDDCPRKAELHTPCPRGYIEWQDWAAQASKTHKAQRCPECNLYAVWVVKPRFSGAELPKVETEGYWCLAFPRLGKTRSWHRRHRA